MRSVPESAHRYDTQVDSLGTWWIKAITPKRRRKPLHQHIKVFIAKPRSFHDRLVENHRLIFNKWLKILEWIFLGIILRLLPARDIVQDQVCRWLKVNDVHNMYA